MRRCGEQERRAGAKGHRSAVVCARESPHFMEVDGGGGEGGSTDANGNGRKQRVAYFYDSEVGNFYYGQERALQATANSELHSAWICLKHTRRLCRRRPRATR
jgi:hypothetical protein